jgi:hypothetical protein
LAWEVKGKEREDREPITHSNRLIEREIGGLGGKLGAKDKGKRGKRERGTDQGN